MCKDKSVNDVERASDSSLIPLPPSNQIDLIENELRRENQRSYGLELEVK